MQTLEFSLYLEQQLANFGCDPKLFDDFIVAEHSHLSRLSRDLGTSKSMRLIYSFVLRIDQLALVIELEVTNGTIHFLAARTPSGLRTDEG